MAEELEHYPDLNATYESEYEAGQDYQSKVPNIIIYSVLLFVGLCANIWMMCSLYRTWKAGSRIQFYLLALCLADILGLCLSCGVIIGNQTTVSWEGGYYGCAIFMALVYFGFCLGHLILADFNIDNMVTVICKRSIKPLRIVLLVLAIALTTGISVPKLFYTMTIETGYPQKITQCVFRGGTLMLVAERIFSLVLFWIPLLLILVFGLIAVCIRCAKKGEMRVSGQPEEGGVENIGRDIILTLTYDVVFILCWSPRSILEVLIELREDLYVSFTTLFYPFSFISIANSCLNPVIYAIFYCINKRNAKGSPGL